MLRAIKILVFAFIGLLVVFILFVAGMRMRGPTESQQAALATLARPMPPVVGRDGSDAIWLLDHDVPEAQRAAVATQLLRYYDERDALTSAGRQPEADRLVDPLSKFPAYAKFPGNEAGLCEEADRNCLATVRADPAGTEATMQRHQAGLRAVLALSAYDGVRTSLKPTLTQAIPTFSSQRKLVRTHFAQMFARGMKDEALAGLCGDIGAWRRLGGNTDMLIGSMVGAAYVRHDLALLGEMVAELPMDARLPSACDAALAPSKDYELDLCPAIRTEFHGVENTISSGITSKDARRPGRALAGLAIDNEHFLATIAPAYAQYCDPAAVQTARLDRSWKGKVAAPRCASMDKLSDPLGCVLIDLTGDNNYSRYLDRRTDLAATLALMRTVLWLREQSSDPNDWPGKLATRPASVGLRREPTIAGDGSEISIALLEQSRDKTYSLLLPKQQQSSPTSAKSP